MYQMAVGLMRDFIDANGVRWTVFEVRRQPVGASGRASYLPDGLSHGWLCFESELGKRRLARFPGDWREFSEHELDTLLHAAQPAARLSRAAEARLHDIDE